MSELKILKVKDPEALKRKAYPPILPDPYSSCVLFLGSVKSGKSTILSNWFLNSGFYGPDFFDDVIVISNTILNDYTMRFMKEKFTIHDHYSDGIINSIIQNQKSYGERENMPNIALIADDVLSTNFKKNNEISFLASRFRHYNIFYVITSQNMRSLSNVIRSNSTSIIVTKQQNENELSKIAEEYGPMFGGEKKFLELYKTAINDEPYSFAYLRLDENPAQFYLRFEKQIYP